MIFHCFPFLDEVNPALVNFLAETYELSTISNVRLHLQGRVFHWLKNLTRHVVHGTLKYFFLSYSRFFQTKTFENSGCWISTSIRASASATDELKLTHAFNLCDFQVPDQFQIQWPASSQMHYNLPVLN